MLGIKLPFVSERPRHAPERGYVTLTINAPIQPIDRSAFFEDPLDDLLRREGMGVVEGGGTMLGVDGGIGYCDLEIQLTDEKDETINKLLRFIATIGAPKGSKLIIESDEREIPVGEQEGLSLYLNGVDLPDETYETCDVDDLIEACDKALGARGGFRSSRVMERETALYFFGPSYDDMRSTLEAACDDHPLCVGARYERLGGDAER